MLDSEEAIQAVVNEAGGLATEEALKQWNKSSIKRLMEKFSVRGMFITTTDEEKPSALWSVGAD